MGARRRAGRSARKQFSKHRRLALRREWRTWLALIALAIASLGLILFSDGASQVIGGWVLGFLTACAVIAWVIGGDVFGLTWLWGSWGEEETEEALRQLGREWYVFHDVPNKFGNWDHIVIGPGGVFMLDSKRLRAPAKAERDGLWSGRTRYNGGTFRGAAIELRESLRAHVRECPYVQAVVVVWGEFEQRLHQEERVVYVSGDRLAEWLATSDSRLSEGRTAALASAMQVIVGNAARSQA